MPTVNWQDHQLFYLEAGNGAGPPLVLLHGWGTSSCFWEHLLPVLSRHRRVLALDWVGYGRSSRPSRAISLAEHAESVVAVLKALAIDTCFLAGHSMGGSIAVLVAAAYPRFVTRLVSCNPVVRARDGLYPRSHRLLFPMARPIAKRLLSFRFFARWLASNSTLTLPIPEWLIDAAMSADREVMMGNAIDLGTLDLLDHLARLTMPVFLLGSDRDAVVRPEQTSLAAEHIPDVQVHRFRGCGHCPPLEEPHAFLQRLGDFLDGDRP